MKKIYHYSVCDETLGEAEGMFTIKGQLIDCWMRDDANWRSEYFNGFMGKLGIEVLPLPEHHKVNARLQMAENFGFSYGIT